MQAIEFLATIHNGIVTIPSQYSHAWEGKSIRVIVLEDNSTENTTTSSQKSDSLFSRLREIKISAPADFSENIDALAVLLVYNNRFDSLNPTKIVSG